MEDRCWWELPSSRGSLQWINGVGENRSSLTVKEDSNTGEVGARELMLVFRVRCGARWNVFWADNPWTWVKEIKWWKWLCNAGPIEDLTKTKMLDASGFPAYSEDTFSILCEDPFDNLILQLLRIVDFFAVLFVVQEEWVYFPLRSLSHVHHAVFWILFSSQRNLVFDSLVLELLLYLILVPNLFCCGFFRLLSQHRSDLPMPVRRTGYRELRYLSSMCHLSRMELCPPCFCWRAFCNISLALWYIRCRLVGPCFAPWSETFFNDVIGNWWGVVVVLVELISSLRRF